jgi:integrase
LNVSRFFGFRIITPEHPFYVQKKAKNTPSSTGYGGRFKPSPYVFTGPLGGPLEPDNLGRYMNKLSSAAGIPRLSPHALRHTYASLALQAGIPVDVVSKQLGHASVTMTLNVYHTVYRSELERWAYSLTQLLYQSKMIRVHCANHF